MSSEKVDFNSLIATAKSSNKNIFIYFGATWCPPCKIMKSQILVDEKVQKQLSNYIVLIVDVDSNPELAKKYKVTGIPYFAILNSDGDVVKGNSGILSENKMAEWLSN